MFMLIFYRTIFKKVLNSMYQHLYIIIIQQDNEPKHTVRLATEYFQRNLNEKFCWLAQSPDVNPIEHVWSVLDSETSLEGRTNMTTFWNEI